MIVDGLKTLLRFALQRNVYTVQHGLARGLKRRGGIAFLKKELTEEERFLLSLDFTGQTIYDIGAWEGVFTCFFARAVGSHGQVITFEPNPKCREHILENVRLNGFNHVRLIGIGLSSTTGKDTLVFSARSLGVGSLQTEIKQQLLNGPGAVSIEIDLDTLDHQIAVHALPPPNLVKIDVEGLEYQVLKGMSETMAMYSPKLYIEIHGAGEQGKLTNAHDVVVLLSQAGYTIQHVESGQSIDPMKYEVAKEGHLYCYKP
jgi:FkbM family methyltransferase